MITAMAPKDEIEIVSGKFTGERAVVVSVGPVKAGRCGLWKPTKIDPNGELLNYSLTKRQVLARIDGNRRAVVLDVGEVKVITRESHAHLEID